MSVKSIPLVSATSPPLGLRPSVDDTLTFTPPADAVTDVPLSAGGVTVSVKLNASVASSASVRTPPRATVPDCATSSVEVPFSVTAPSPGLQPARHDTTVAPSAVSPPVNAPAALNATAPPPVAFTAPAPSMEPTSVILCVSAASSAASSIVKCDVSNVSVPLSTVSACAVATVALLGFCSSVQSAYDFSSQSACVMYHWSWQRRLTDVSKPIPPGPITHVVAPKPA